MHLFEVYVPLSILSLLVTLAHCLRFNFEGTCGIRLHRTHKQELVVVLVKILVALRPRVMGRGTGQVTRMEFGLLWGTYLSIMFTDLETGIGIGIVLATFFFAISYARVRSACSGVVACSQPHRG